MADFLSTAERSVRMALIKGKNTTPELMLRSALHKSGFRFRLHDRDLPGKPDIVMPRFKTIIFVNGCFWHGHHCQKDRAPVTNSNYWLNKILANRKRDAKNIHELRALGWRVIVVWECTIRTKNSLQKTVNYICNRLATC